MKKINLRAKLQKNGFDISGQPRSVFTDSGFSCSQLETAIRLYLYCIYKKQNAICIDSGLLVSGIKIAFQKYVRIANTDIKKIKIVYIDFKTSSPLRQVIFWKICKYTDPALLFQKNGTSSHTNSPLKSYFAEGNADSPLILCGAVRFLRPLCPLCVLCG